MSSSASSFAVFFLAPFDNHASAHLCHPASCSAHKVWEPSAELGGHWGAGGNCGERPNCNGDERVCCLCHGGNGHGGCRAKCVDKDDDCDDLVPQVKDNTAMDNEFNDVDDSNDEGSRVAKGGLRASALVVEE